MRVYATGTRVRELRQLVGVGALEFRQAAMLQNFGRQRIVFGQLFQHLFVGTGRTAWRFFDHRQTQFGEKNLADLLGRAEVERLTRQLVRFTFQLQNARAQLAALFGQHGRIDQHAVALDAVERFAAFHFQLVDEKQLRVFFQQRPQHAVYVQRLVGVFARVLGGFDNIDLIELDLVRALAAQVFVVNAAAPGMPLGQTGQAVRLMHFEHIALQHGVMRVALHFNAVVGKHVAVVFDVLTQLGFGPVFQPGLEAGQHLVTRQLRWRVGVVVRERNIGGLAGRHAEADTDDFGAHLIKRRGFGIDCGQISGFEFFQPRAERFPGKNRVVFQIGGAL